MQSTQNPTAAPYATPLAQIPLLVLLSLLGAGTPRIPSFFPPTHWAYTRIATIESRLRSLHLLESHLSDPSLPFFPYTSAAAVDPVSDDHEAFLSAGVPVLHVVPEVLTPVWHTAADRGEELEEGTVRDWARIVTAFVCEWLDMMEVWPEE